MANQVRYFRLTDDINVPNRWYLGDVRNADNWLLASGKALADPHADLKVEVYRHGDAMDFTLTEAYGIPIVSSKVKDGLADLPGVRFLPVTVVGTNLLQSYFIVLIEYTVDCVDEDASEFETFSADDPVRPDKAGQYKAFFKLVVDKGKAKAAGKPVFRLAKFEVAIIVNADVKGVLDAVGTRGAAMVEV